MSWDAASRSLAALVFGPLSLSAYVACGLFSYALLPLAGVGAVGSSSSSLVLCLPFAALCALAAAPGARSLLGQRRSSREIARLTAGRALMPSPRLAAAAARAGLSGRVTVVDDRDAFSFVHGALRPSVVISRGLLEDLSAAELHAVLAHERYHVAQLDPLRTVLARALCSAFFFLPALRALAARYMTARELAADECAAARHGARALAGAMLKAARAQAQGSVMGPAALAEPSTLDARLRLLESGVRPKLARPSVVELVLSLLGAGVFLGAFVLALGGIAGAQASRRALSIASVHGLFEAVLWLGPVACALLCAYWWLARRAGTQLPLSAARASFPREAG